MARAFCLHSHIAIAITIIVKAKVGARAKEKPESCGSDRAEKIKLFWEVLSFFFKAKSGALCFR